MDMQTAVDNFTNSMAHCDNMVAVHRAAGSGTPGRRRVETSVNRGVIVTAVATWQAFVQDVAQALRDVVLTELQKASGSALVAGAATQWETDFKTALKRFSTPNPDNLKALLGRTGFDPQPQWTWKQRGGRGSGSFVVEPKHVRQVLSQWIEIRHDVAHGNE
ncbi:hypothetical protein [Allokutzneria sp. NRRL B-24872]|uniref:hypothetical protein n=1 Tax=Allokutzneria sp. NRRL B-24872 TaxID=1137961 RepID=UPI001177AF48|nr:hypothetical protein [Allokutzneria sp. NRRL B-24872]